MNLSKKMITTAIALALVGTLGTAGLLGANKVLAATETNTSPVSSLIQKIATKFNLKQSEVQAVFDEHKTEMNAQRQKTYEDRLTRLVTEGKITDAQKQLMIAKNKELQANREANRENMQNLTPEERKTKMNEERKALETWAKDHNIDMKYLMLGHGGRGGHGPMGEGFGPKNGIEPSNI